MSVSVSFTVEEWGAIIEEFGPWLIAEALFTRAQLENLTSPGLWHPSDHKFAADPEYKAACRICSWSPLRSTHRCGKPLVNHLRVRVIAAIARQGYRSNRVLLFPVENLAEAALLRLMNKQEPRPSRGN